MILLFELVDVHCFEESVLQKTRSKSSHTGVRSRDENTSNVYDVSRINRSSEGTVQMDSHRPRNVTHRDLVGHFLDFDLLEGPESTSSSLHVQLALGLVPDTDVRGTNSERGEMFLGDFLEDLITTRVTGVGVDYEEGLDFRNTGNDTSHGDKLAEMGTSNCSNGKDVVRSKWAEVYIAISVRTFPYQLRASAYYRLINSGGNIPASAFLSPASTWAFISLRCCIIKSSTSLE